MFQSDAQALYAEIISPGEEVQWYGLFSTTDKVYVSSRQQDRLNHTLIGCKESSWAAFAQITLTRLNTRSGLSGTSYASTFLSSRIARLEIVCKSPFHLISHAFLATHFGDDLSFRCPD